VRRLGLGLALVAALAIVAAGAAVGQRRQRESALSPLASADNTGPAGLAAARTLLLERGHAVATVRSPGDTPPESAVVIVAAPGASLSEDDVSGLLQRAARGGTLLWAAGGAPQPELERRLLARLSPYPGTRAALPLAPHPLVQGVVLPVNEGAVSSSHPAALPIAGSRDTTSVVSIAWGRGEVLLLSGPEPLSNEHLAEGNALSFLTRLAARGPVLFDERWLVSRGGPPAAAPPLAALLAQALLAGLAWVLARGRRLGAVRPPPARERGRTARDYLRSLAALYRRAGAEGELARSAWARARRELERTIGLPSRLGDAEAEARLALRAPHLVPAFARARAGLAAPPGPAALLEVVRAAAELESSRRGGARNTHMHRF